MPTTDDEIRSIAAELHQAWRETRRRGDTYEPRLKPDDEGNVVDIANLDYSSLPVRWQEENMAAARSAEQAVITAVTLDEAAEHVHDEWVKRNYDIAEDEQRCDYRVMVETEKNKDRQIARIVSRVTRRPLADPTNVGGTR